MLPQNFDCFLHNDDILLDSYGKNELFIKSKLEFVQFIH